jgi:hypothetical protein
MVGAFFCSHHVQRWAALAHLDDGSWLWDLEVICLGEPARSWQSTINPMPRKKRCKVFVSYSRHDEELVKPLAGLLGAAANDAVFLDVTSIKPGEVWKSEIETALREAPVFVLCWCCESQNSSVVAWEIATAMLWGGGESASCPTLPSRGYGRSPL